MTANGRVAAITHGDCGTAWSGLSVAHCAGCGRTFSGTTLFDRHRTNAGERGKCLDPNTLTARDGTKVCEFRDGMWRFPGMSDADKVARFGVAT